MEPQEKQLDTGAKGKPEGAKEKVAGEAHEGAADMVAKLKAHSDYLKAGGVSGISRTFGKMILVDSGQSDASKQAAGTKIAERSDEHKLSAPVDQKKEGSALADHKYEGSAPAEAPVITHQSTQESAVHIQSRAEFELQHAHNGLKNTLMPGGPLLIIQPDTALTVPSQQTSEVIAMIQLGPNVTPEQRKAYIAALEDANKAQLQVGPDGTKTFPAGANIRLPGQSADGAITYTSGDSTKTVWSDGSSMYKKRDGSGGASYKLDDHDVVVSWNPNKPEGNQWSSENTVTIAGLPHHMRFVTSIDAKGSVTDTTYGANPTTPDSVRITERSGAVTELRPGADGEFHGQKTDHGTVVDGDVGMTSSGRVYSRHFDADGNTVKAFENSRETYNATGVLVAWERTGADQKVTTNKYKEDGTFESQTIVDKDKNVIELKPVKGGELKGVEKDPDGHVIAQVGMDKGTGDIYKWKETTTGITKTYDDGKIVKTDWHNRVLETTQKDSQGRTITENVHSKPPTLTIKGDDYVMTMKQGAHGEFHGVKKDAAGHVIDNNVGRDASGQVFSETKDATGVTRTFEDHRTEKTDPAGNVIERTGKDTAGRDLTQHFHPGDSGPYQVEIKINPGDPPLIFDRAADGRLLHENKSSTGEVLSTVDVNLSTGDLHYHTQRTGADWTVHKDGTANGELRTGPDDVQRTRMSKDGDLVTTEVHKDASGKEHVVRETYMDPKGTIFRNSYTNDVLDHIVIQKSDGIIDLHNPGYDPWKGTFISFTGKVETVRMFPGNAIVYKDENTGTMHEDKVSWKPGRYVPSLEKHEYDTNTGKYTDGELGPTKILNTHAPGRMDMVTGDGSVYGMTITGDLSYQKSDGHAAVVHPTQEGARFTEDGKIEMWSPAGTKQDTLTPHEESFLKTHPEVDRRDFLEIHRKHADDKAKLDEMYAQLERVNSADKLSAEEKSGLVKTFMHHVAYPAEIYQGHAPTCHVSVIQRDLAIGHPETYAKFVMDAVVDGEFETANGTKVPYDVDNLKMTDFSGRDIGTRIFQTAALNLLLYPEQAVRNSEDGVAKAQHVLHHFVNGEDIPIGDTQDVVSLNLVQIAKIRNEITGESKALIKLQSVEDLERLIKQNAPAPTTIWVDAHSYPFSGGGPLSNAVSGHFTTITGVDQGPPVKFYVQNQWGLESDHSSLLTAVEAQDVFNNMSRVDGTTGMALGPAPDSGKVYDAKAAGTDGLDLKEAK